MRNETCFNLLLNDPLSPLSFVLMYLPLRFLYPTYTSDSQTTCSTGAFFFFALFEQLEDACVVCWCVDVQVFNVCPYTFFGVCVWVIMNGNCLVYMHTEWLKYIRMISFIQSHRRHQHDYTVYGFVLIFFCFYISWPVPVHEFSCPSVFIAHDFL